MLRTPRFLPEAKSCERSEQPFRARRMSHVYNQHSEARENLVMFGKDKLSWGEWLTILFLGALLLASLFYIKDSSLISIIFTGAITSAVLLLFIVLRDLNNLNFGENAVSIEPYERVLDAIGKPRYYKTKRRVII